MSWDSLILLDILLLLLYLHLRQILRFLIFSLGRPPFFFLCSFPNARFFSILSWFFDFFPLLHGSRDFRIAFFEKRSIHLRVFFIFPCASRCVRRLFDYVFGSIIGLGFFWPLCPLSSTLDCFFSFSLTIRPPPYLSPFWFTLKCPVLVGLFREILILSAKRRPPPHRVFLKVFFLSGKSPLSVLSALVLLSRESFGFCPFHFGTISFNFF